MKTPVAARAKPIHILSHEIGHKIYHELLDKNQIKKWLIISSQESVEKSIKQSYHAVKILEEQFCWMVSIIICFTIMNPKTLKRIKEKEKEILKTNPKGYTFVQSILGKGVPKNYRFKPKKGESVTYYWQVLAFKKWLFGDPHIKTFKK